MVVVVIDVDLAEALSGFASIDGIVDVVVVVV